MYFIYFCLALAGYFGRRLGLLSTRLLSRLTWLLVHIIYPMLIISSLTHHFRRQELIHYWDLPTALALLMFLGFALGSLALRYSQSLKANLNPSQRQSFLFMSAMPNYVFLPLTIASLLLDDSAVSLIILASFGGDLFLWLVAVPLIGNRHGQLFRALAKAPVLAMLFSLIVIASDHDFCFAMLDAAYPVMHGVGSLTVPLSMLILGLHLGGDKMASKTPNSGYRQANRLLLWHRFTIMPALAMLVLTLLPLPEAHANIIRLISFMPTAIASAILTPYFGGDAHFCARQVFDSHLLAILVIPLASFLLL